MIEVGLGGRLDATNALPNPVVSGISLLDLDHTAILGDTIQLIAGEKVRRVHHVSSDVTIQCRLLISQAGILKPGTPAVTVAVQPADAVPTLREAALRAGAPLYLAPPLHAYSGGDGSAAGIPLGLAGDFQRDNAALAVALARLFAVRCAPWLIARGAAEPAAAWARACTAAWAGESGRWRPWASGAECAAAANRPAESRPATGGNELEPGAAGELTEVELSGLAATRWPGRAQVCRRRLASGHCP